MRVLVVGMGKTGLPIAVALHQRGHEVWGVDFESRLEQIKDPDWETEEGECSYEIRKSLHLTSDIGEAVHRTDLGILIVGTPEDGLNAQGELSGIMDLTQVKNASKAIGNSLQGRRYILLVSSTVMPGTCRDIIKPLVGPSCEVVSNPIWIALGSVVRDYLHPPVLVLGAEPFPAELFQFAAVTFDTVPMVTDPTTAEALKIVYNVWCTTKMTFANYAAEVMRNVGADYSMLEPFMRKGGERPGSFLRPGAPFGGPCFPRDLRFARHISEGIGKQFVNVIDDFNKFLAYDLASKALKISKRVGIAGLTYKSGVSVIEESQAHLVVHYLANANGYTEKIISYDALVKQFPGAQVTNSLEYLYAKCAVVIELLPGLIPQGAPIEVVRSW